MRRVLQGACACGGDLMYVDDSFEDSKSSRNATATEYVSTWQRRCSSCGDVREYRDVTVVPVSFTTTRSGPLFCELCTTQLTANPNEQPALDGQDWYCPSCEFGGGEANGPQCTQTRVVEDWVEQCALDLDHDGEHGGPSGEEWVMPDESCRAVTKTKDEHAVPVQCSALIGHEGDHHAKGGYYWTTEDRVTTHHEYELRWSTWSPAEERAKTGAPPPDMQRPPLN